MTHTLAIDIGGTKLALAALAGPRLVRREMRATHRDAGRQDMLTQILAIARQWRQEISFDRCGVGFGGPVDFAAQTIARSTHVAGWEGFPLARYLGDELGLPAIIDNDGNVGALGEATDGAGRGADPLVYITISTGIGGGIISGGKLLRGRDSMAGEIGHIPVRPDGPVCPCGGRGCLERLCSGLSLQRDHGRSAEELLKDPAFVRRYVVDLALGLKTVIMLLNPARIVIGGGVSKAGDALFLPLREQLKMEMQAWPWIGYAVVPAALGGDSVLYGAAALARSLPA